MPFNSTELSTSKGASDTVSVNDWNVGLGDNIKTGLMRCIAQAETSAAAASIAIASLSTAFRSLHFEMHIRCATTSLAEQGLNLRFNNDSAASYWEKNVYTNGTAFTFSTGIAATNIWLGQIPASSTAVPTGAYAQFVVDVYGYATTGQLKPVTWQGFMRMSSGAGGYYLHLGGGEYNSLAGITEVDLLPTAGNLSSGCLVTVWGQPYNAT